MDQMVIHVTMKDNVIARKLILLVKCVINVVLDPMGFLTVTVGLTINGLSKVNLE